MKNIRHTVDATFYEYQYLYDTASVDKVDLSDERCYSKGIV